MRGCIVRWCHSRNRPATNANWCPKDENMIFRSPWKISAFQLSSILLHFKIFYLGSNQNSLQVWSTKSWCCLQAFMFCPHCIQSMHVPTKFGCFICLESIRNEFIPLGKDLLAGKLNYLQRGGCCKKKWKKVKKFDIMEKNRPQIIFFNWRGCFDQKLPEESDKNGPDALQRWF